ncbi:hypothetical protein BDFB_013136 [Asbolus verrucosus]|uniref:Uncharacterized protein n=1 Tax=Asbolus verrucosus TaxID=1661398 RepID=A0A482V8F4_ASBVE|nr:hypothetical protein BDFB_013136 [Asbolus verrucosus]
MFTPGSFVTESNIIARHADHIHEMHKAFTKEQHAFYEDYFQRYNAHLLGINIFKIPEKIKNNTLYNKFEEALMLETPKAAYKVEPFRYTLYHLIFKLTPFPIRDCFVVKFMNMPQYNMTQT